MNRIHVSPDVSFPLAFVTQATSVLARRGAGKSYTAAVIGEQVIEAGQPLIILDPLGGFWGLRSSADGKKAGLPVIILGGSHGDVPLEPTAGKLIGNLVVEHPGAYVIDLSLFESNASQDRFATDFCETLYRAKAHHPTAQLLIIDEADSFAPQRPGDNQQRMLGSVEAIVRRGRSRGLGVVLISQRAAVLNKNVLTQSETLIILQTTSPQDRAAIEAWIEGNGTKEGRDVVLASLASLEVGEAWVWSPAINLLERTHIQRRKTFDSSATPKPGEARIEPQKRSEIDLEVLGQEILATVQRAKDNDPSALRAKIRSLESDLMKKPVQAPPERVEVPVLTPEFHEAIRGCHALLAQAASALEVAHKDLEKINGTVERFEKPRYIPSTKSPQYRPEPRFRVEVARAMERDIRKADADNGKIPKGERAILIACAQHNTCSREQLTVLTGYRRSSRDAYIQRLREKDLIVVEGNEVMPTRAGVDALGQFEPLPVGNELRGYWMARLPRGEQIILDVVCKAHPNWISREMISEQSEYERSSRDAYLQRLKAKRLVETERGQVKASDMLFG